MKPLSLKTSLIIPSILAFSVFSSLIAGIGYTLYNSSIRESYMDQMEFASGQIQRNYENYFDSVISASSGATDTYVNLPSVHLQGGMANYFADLMLLRSEVIGAAVYKAGDGSLLSSSRGFEYSSPIGESYFDSAKQDPYINWFTLAEDSSGNQTFILSRYMFYTSDSSYDAVLRIDFDLASVVDAVSPVYLGDGGRFIIYDRDYRVVYGSDTQNMEEALSLVADTVIGSREVNMGGSAYYLYCMTISSTAWRMAIFVNFDSFYSSIGTFLTFTISFTAGVIFLFALLTVLVTRASTSSLLRLRQEMMKTESLDILETPYKPLRGPREVRDLGDSYYAMRKRISDLIKALEKEGDERRKSELKALQNQINPHFLYNTLDSIISLIEVGRSKEAEKMIVSLSRFFRISISKGHSVIPLEDELEHVGHYLSIQKTRFGTAFDYEVEKGGGLEGVKVEKLILQPIVENCIAHGLKEGETTHISIKVVRVGDMLSLSVEDDGYGMSNEALEKLRKSLEDPTIYQGVGVSNVYRRLRVRYGDKAKMEISSEEDVGTKVSMEVPLLGEEDNE